MPSKPATPPLDRKQFKRASDALGATLERLAPEYVWMGEEYKAGEGYACQWFGFRTEPRWLLFRKERRITFFTYSWSWDGHIDEAYIADKIAHGTYSGYALSDNLPSDLRRREAKAWERTNDEFAPSLIGGSWLLDQIVGAVAGTMAVCFGALILIGLPVMVIAWIVRMLLL